MLDLAWAETAPRREKERKRNPIFPKRQQFLIVRSPVPQNIEKDYISLYINSNIVKQKPKIPQSATSDTSGSRGGAQKLLRPIKGQVEAEGEEQESRAAAIRWPVTRTGSTRTFTHGIPVNPVSCGSLVSSHFEASLVSEGRIVVDGFVNTCEGITLS